MSVDMNAYGVLLSYLGGSGFTRLLDRVESKAKRLINCPVLSSSLDPLSLRRDVGVLSLFYRYHSGRCSRELSTLVPPPLRCPRSTRGAVSANEFCVDVSNSRLVRCGASFFPATSVLWNSLPSSVFPTQFNLPPVSYTHLRAHETPEHLVCRLLLEKKKKKKRYNNKF